MLASNQHLHVQISCHDTCLVSLILDIRLDTLIFMSLKISGTHNLEHGLLISLQATTTFIYKNAIKIK